MRETHHRYPFPPLLDADLPPEVPWDTPIHQLSDFWLELQCGSCGSSTTYPLRLMAAVRGWNITLRQIVPRMRCKTCRVPPSVLNLKEGGADLTGRPAMLRLNLLA